MIGLFAFVYHRHFNVARCVQTPKIMTHLTLSSAAAAILCQGCAVVTVADAAVSVAATAVKVTASVVETTVDVTAAGVKAVAGSAEADKQDD